MSLKHVIEGMSPCPSDHFFRDVCSKFDIQVCSGVILFKEFSKEFEGETLFAIGSCSRIRTKNPWREQKMRMRHSSSVLFFTPFAPCNSSPLEFVPASEQVVEPLSSFDPSVLSFRISLSLSLSLSLYVLDKKVNRKNKSRISISSFKSSFSCFNQFHTDFFISSSSSAADKIEKRYFLFLRICRSRTIL